MSTVVNNVITEGLSGKIGKNYTFVQTTNGKTIIRRIPAISKKVSDAQQAQREKFKLVVQQAREALQDAEQKANFEAQTKKGGTVLGTAFKYFYALTENKPTEV